MCWKIPTHLSCAIFYPQFLKTKSFHICNNQNKDVSNNSSNDDFLTSFPGSIRGMNNNSTVFRLIIAWAYVVTVSMFLWAEGIFSIISTPHFSICGLSMAACDNKANSSSLFSFTKWNFFQLVGIFISHRLYWFPSFSFFWLILSGFHVCICQKQDQDVAYVVVAYQCTAERQLKRIH